jgi:choline O-acetyltransferase
MYKKNFFLFKSFFKDFSSSFQTISGNGPDNHLLGLREISRMKLGDIPMLLKEKSYKEYINFRLSTSQLPTEKGILAGYGPVVPDGYGCSYNPCNQSIVFCISSFFSSAETSSDFFALSLEGSLLQMRELCVKLLSYQTPNKLQ